MELDRIFPSPPSLGDAAAAASGPAHQEATADALVAAGVDLGQAVLRLQQEANAAREEAERASRAKDEFLAMLGHELRNPLAPIVTALHLMKLRGSGELERALIERQAALLQQMDHERSRRAGCDDHYVKPLAPETLQQLVSSLEAVGGSETSTA
jgi:signal transduction histidine kinase